MPETHCAIKSEIVHVPMRDGVKLSTHIHRPDSEGRFPAIVAYTPYRKGRLGAPDPIVAHGYATVTFDIRGTGNSGGWNDSIYSDPERQDGYDMVEWAAAQPWCTGHVGMWGISFGAVVALQTAFAAPPHLNAIIARSGCDDPYTEWTNPGGSPRPYMYACYAPIMTAANFSPPDPEELGEAWAGIWEERLRKNVPWGIPFIQNLVDGPFWRARSLRDKYDRVRCAVYVVDGWADWYHSPLLRTFANLTVPKRALMGPWSHQWPDQGIPGPRVDWASEKKRWFDHWLKGIDNGIMKEPPVTLFIREYSPPATILVSDRGQFRSETEWPIARTQDTPLYFESDGRLSHTPPTSEGNDADALIYDPRVGMTTGMHGGGPFNTNWTMPLDQRPDEARGIVYTSVPLEQDLEVTDQPVAVLHFSSTAPVVAIAVKLCDVAPDGTSALVTKGFLNVTHRESHAAPLFLEPGRVYPLNVELLTCAYRFLKGHRIRVNLAGADFLNIWPTPLPCTNTFCRHVKAPSHIRLPIVPIRNPALPPVALAPSPAPLPRREDLAEPDYSIRLDPIHDTARLEYEVAYGSNWINTARYTVSARAPALAVIRGESRCRHELPGRNIVVKADCVTTSDTKAFHHTVTVDITINDQPHFNQHWSVSVPRGYA